MENIEKKFEKYGETLSPSMEAEDKIWGVVSSKLSLKESPAKSSKLISVLFMKRFMKFSLAVFVVCFVIAVPLYLNRNNGVGSSLTSALVPQAGVINEKDEASKTQGLTTSYNTPVMPYLDGNVTPDNTTLEADRAKKVDAYLIYKVADVALSSEKVKKIIEDAGGYTSSSNVSVNEAYYVIKVPVTKYRSVYDQLKAIASSVESENITSVDQQDTVTNLQISIKNMDEKIAELQKQYDSETDTYKKESLKYQIEDKKQQRKSIELSLTEVVKTTEVSTINLTLRKDGSQMGLSLSQSLQETLYKIQDVAIIWINLVLIAVVACVAISPIVIPVLIYRSRRKKSSR